MDHPEDVLFQTTSNISIPELEEKYGELLPGDIVFKMAEHKNFEAAKAAFKPWFDANAFDIHYFLHVAFPFEEWLEDPIDSFIARSFVMKLLDEYNDRPRADRERPLSTEALTLRRLAGELPHLAIDETDFTVDWKNRELRETANPSNKLDLHAMELSPQENSYLSYYHLADRKNYVPDEFMIELPQNVMLLEIPHELILDPVAVIQEQGLDNLSLLRNHPVLAGLSGKLIPLTETLLPQIIAENLLTQEQQVKSKIGR